MSASPICWVHLPCSLPAHQRTIELEAIAGRTKLAVDGVEFLLMKTLSLHLIEGVIDQVAGNVQVGQSLSLLETREVVLARNVLHVLPGPCNCLTLQVTWVQPRVLTMPQVSGVKDRLDGWISKVTASSTLLEEETADVVVA